MSMTVAFGTSMPTSITVVATKTSISPSRNRRMIVSRSSAGTRPCSSATRRSANGPVDNTSNIVVAALRSVFSDSSITG